MNLKIFTPVITVTLPVLGSQHTTTEQELLAINPPEVIKAFLADDEMMEITIRTMGSAFTAVRYTKRFIDSEKQALTEQLMGAF